MGLTLEGDLNGAGLKMAIVVARFNGIVTGYLLDGAKEALRRHGVADDDVDVVWVPGSFEISLIAKQLGETETVHWRDNSSKARSHFSSAVSSNFRSS